MAKAVPRQTYLLYNAVDQKLNQIPVDSITEQEKMVTVQIMYSVNDRLHQMWPWSPTLLYLKDNNGVGIDKWSEYCIFIHLYTEKHWNCI